ncbi:unnamed protein product [Rangifer tarandus platyrhynchus]|uniref:Uncharacterized protein n=2 Tax=Rangifer tarandus platyrhynchus TaxID=3082113 RepID=A0ABN8YT06_RANTA|nr:unnamed protein product [Rangifer tarandus platyrhynchus]
MLFIECCFQLPEFGALLVGIHHLVFQKELMIEDSLPIPSYTRHLLYGMNIGFCCGWWWFICRPHRLFHSTLLYSIHFLLLVTICFKTGAFSLCVSGEWHAEI